MLIPQALERTLRQTADLAFWRVLVLGLVLSVAALIAAGALAGWLVGQQELAAEGGWATLVQWAAGLAVVWLGFLFFVPLSAVVMGLFLDPIVDAVERRFYPDDPAGPPLGLVRAGWLGLRLGVIVLAANIVVIPLYILTIWIPFFAMVLFYGLNAYLLGWGFYDLVATRHFDRAGYNRVRKTMRGDLFLFGVLVTTLYFVPVLNLALPVLGAAMMVHLIHGRLAQEEAAHAAQ